MDLSHNSITVTVEGKQAKVYPSGTLVKELLKEVREDKKRPYLGALVNNDVVSLSYPLEVDSHIQFLTSDDKYGRHIYRSSLIFLLAKAVHTLYPAARLYVEHSLEKGFYCNLDIESSHGVTPAQLNAIEARMLELVKQRLPIERHKLFFVDALKHFEKQNQHDRCNLLRFRNPPNIVVYVCGDFVELAYTPLAENTAALSDFQLISYPPGFIFQVEDLGTARPITPREEQKQLIHVFREHKEWGKILGIRTVGDLNATIAQGQVSSLIKITEAFHEKKVAHIADIISARRQQTKWVLIAGPSSSGKTTFAKRLAIQLQVSGLHPIIISVDDYYIERSKLPRDENGEYDLENINALDLPLFHEHLRRLDRGEEVELPHFSFKKGHRQYSGDRIHVAEGQVVIIEGIHSLNPQLTEPIPASRKFKIYINALAQLNLEYSQRISTTDNRLIRRLARDHHFRGYTALTTMAMWPSVRRGEETWIFPFQKHADIIFNSALDYELAVLKPLVEPLLSEIKPIHPEYADARRLQEFLAYFISAPATSVPPTSIIREFIGQSSFEY